MNGLFLKDSRIKLFLLIILLMTLSVFYAEKINLTNSDIGRHIKNGEMFFENRTIVDSNFYSYTEPDFKTVAHHWVYGGFAYLVWNNFGFEGLSILNILLYLLTFIIIFKIAREKSDYRVAFFFALLSLPLLIYRKEIRPEVFSYLFLAVYYLLLIKFKEDKINYKILILFLVPLQILWVNMHIFFAFGFAMISFFAIDSYFNDKKKLKQYILLLVSVILVSLINPYFLNGLLEPFFIFKEYGYLVAENVSILFMQARSFNYIYFYIQFMFLLGVASFFVSRKGLKRNILNVLLFACFGILAFKMTRLITLFGFILIPVLSENFKDFYRNFPSNRKKIFSFLIASLLLLVIFISLFSVLNNGKGLGLKPGVQNSYNFFIENRLEGPIFNNYDVGGYLIFNLFPKEKVFVDNRPEAYSVEFFREIYIPMQEDDDAWEKYQEEYGFNIIYFYRYDMTPWGQRFLIERISDPMWIPVYVDEYTIIYLKDNEKNKEIIEKFELPREMFIFITR